MTEELKKTPIPGAEGYSELADKSIEDVVEEEISTEISALILGDDTVVPKGALYDTLTKRAVSKVRKASKQTSEDPFSARYESPYSLIQPPYNLDQLLYMSEMQPLHSAALEQKVADTIGKGWKWVPLKDGADEEQLTAVKELMEWPNPDMTFQELLEATQTDYESLANNYVEIVRNGGGKINELYHVPGHTMRIHKDKTRYCQSRQGKFVYFKKWGEERDLDIKSGQWAEPGALPEEQQANEILTFRRVVSRSSFYGIPGYVSAIGAISASLSARDFNLGFFGHAAMPAWAVIVEGAKMSPKFQQTVEEFFKREVKGQHHRTFVAEIPYVPARASGENRVKVRFERLSDQIRDMSWRWLLQSTNLEILIAHRVPPYRVGWPVIGSLGGSAAREMDLNYKYGLITPRQNTLAAWWNRFFRKEFKITDWEWRPEELDLTDFRTDVETVVVGVEGHVLTINEARVRLGLPEHPDGNVLWMQGAAPRSPNGTGNPEVVQALAEVTREMGELRESLESVDLGSNGSA